MIKTVFFDIGGVYIKCTYELKIRNISGKLGMEEEKIREIVGKYREDFSTGGMSERDFCGRISSELGIDANAFQNLWYVPELLEVDGGVRDIIIKLKAKGYAVGVVTYTDPIYLEMNSRNGIYDIFDFVANSVDTKSRKRQRTIFLDALRLSGSKADECVMIDDREQNLVKAGEIGMKTILFRDVTGLRKELEKLGVL